MTTPDNLVVIYKELADWHERQGRPQMRDRFLVLAADAALSAGRPAEADLLLARLLRTNPHHMLRSFTSFAAAMASPNINTYVAELRRTYPPQQAAEQFDSLRASRGAPAPRRPTSTIPPTAPVVDLDDEIPQLDEDREPLKVYRIQDDTEPPPAPPRPAPPAAPRPPAPAPRPVPRPPRPSPPALGVDVTPTMLAAPPSPADAEDTARGSWVAVVLFVLVLLAGLALGGWTLLEPFLPHR
jgi:hypothetical protein